MEQPDGGPARFVRALGVADLPPLTSPFDPGYDLETLRGHLEQSAHLMNTLKISMSCWLIANERVTREKFAAAKSCGVATVTGGGPFEIARAAGRLPGYLELCADLGAARIECGQGFTAPIDDPAEIVRRATDAGLDVQFELGQKHSGTFTSSGVEDLIDIGKEWLDAGALQLVVEARESALGVGVFDSRGALQPDLADRLVEAFGHDVLLFEAPDKPSQFALLSHFGTGVQLTNVRLEEILRVEIYRRGLHADSYDNPRLGPPYAHEA